MRLVDADYLLSKHEPLAGGIYVDVWDIETAPTIDPVKHGKWIDISGCLASAKNWSCSECGNAVGINPSKYCSNCGAKMDKEGRNDRK